MKIIISSAELQKFPDAMARLVPTLDVTPLKAMLEGVTFPSAGSITVNVKLTPTDTLIIEVDVNP